MFPDYRKSILPPTVNKNCILVRIDEIVPIPRKTRHLQHQNG